MPLETFDPSAMRPEEDFDPSQMRLESSPRPAPTNLNAKISRGLQPVPGQTSEQTLTQSLSPGIAPTVGAGATFGHNFVDKLALGFGDELGGAVEATLAGHPFSQYAQKRDEIKRALEYSNATNPKSALAGSLAGGVASAFIPGATAVKGGATLATAGKSATILGKLGLTSSSLAQSAVMGGLYGIGESEGDLTKGELGKVLRDAGVSAGASVALSAVLGKASAKAIGDAPERVLSRTARDVVDTSIEGARGTGKVLTRAVAKIGGDEGKEALRDTLGRTPQSLQKTLATKAASAPAKTADAVFEHVSNLHDEAGKFYQAINKASGGVSVEAINARMEVARLAALKQGKAAVAEAIGRGQESLMRNYAPQGAGATVRIGADTVRGLATDLGKNAFGMMPGMDYTTRTLANRALSKAGVEAIEAEAKSAGVAGIDKLRTLNKDMSLWLDVGDVLAQKGAREAAGAGSLRSIVGKGVTQAIGAGIGSSLGGPLGAAAGSGVAVPLVKAGSRIVGSTLRGADYRLAQLATKMQGSGATAKAVSLAKKAAHVQGHVSAVEPLASRGDRPTVEIPTQSMGNLVYDR